MGPRQIEQAALFYEFSLERHVPADHLLRSIDRFVELGELRRELAAFYSTMGRPSIDPGSADSYSQLSLVPDSPRARGKTHKEGPSMNLAQELGQFGPSTQRRQDFLDQQRLTAPPAWKKQSLVSR